MGTWLEKVGIGSKRRSVRSTPQVTDSDSESELQQRLAQNGFTLDDFNYVTGTNPEFRRQRALTPGFTKDPNVQIYNTEIQLNSQDLAREKVATFFGMACEILITLQPEWVNKADWERQVYLYTTNHQRDWDMWVGRDELNEDFILHNLPDLEEYIESNLPEIIALFRRRQ